MKKLVLLTVAFVAFFSSNIKAQENGMKNNYVKLQLVQPIGEYKDYYRTGFGAEFGRMFTLDFEIADGMVMPGLDITFLNTSFNTGKDHDYFKATNFSGTEYKFQSQGGLVWQLGIKLGPMVTFGITDGLVADVSLQYDPTLIFNFRKGASEDAWNKGNGRFDKRSASCVAFAHMVGFKADIRYSHFLFGMEFKLGNASFNYNHDILPYEEGTITNGSNQTATNVKFADKKSDMGLGTLLLNFGLTF